MITKNHSQEKDKEMAALEKIWVQIPAFLTQN